MEARPDSRSPLKTRYVYSGIIFPDQVDDLLIATIFFKSLVTLKWLATDILHKRRRQIRPVSVHVIFDIRLRGQDIFRCRQVFPITLIAGKVHGAVYHSAL